MIGNTMLENFHLYNDDCRNVMRDMRLNDVKVDVTICSPPYDNLRTYNNSSTWNFEIFKEIASLLYDVTNDGGVVVWVVGDETRDGSETGTSFRQALYFMELGFKLHDTMIYEKNGCPFPASEVSKRYTQIFEYMFVLVKGKIHDCQLLADKKNSCYKTRRWGNSTWYDKDGSIKQIKKVETKEYGLRNNIWQYKAGFFGKKKDYPRHPAVFPLQLAVDHILSWSKPEYTIFDPFLGSGTTMDACIKTGRHNFIGCEIDKQYFEIIMQKYQEYSQLLFI